MFVDMSNMEKYRYKRPPNSILRRVNPLFHTQNKDADSKELSRHLIKVARKTGQLNLSGRGLVSGMPIVMWYFGFSCVLLPPKRRLICSGLYGAIFQKIELVITIAVRTPAPQFNANL
jgi:hypothetical protein